MFILSRDLTWPPHWGVMRIYGCESSWYVIAMISLVTIVIVIVEVNCFQFVMWPHVNTCLNGYVNLWMKSFTVSHNLVMSDCHWSSAYGDVKYLMSCDLAKSCDWIIIKFNEWDFFMVFHHYAKVDHNYCGSRDTMFSCDLARTCM